MCVVFFRHARVGVAKLRGAVIAEPVSQQGCAESRFQRCGIRVRFETHSRGLHSGLNGRSAMALCPIFVGFVVPSEQRKTAFAGFRNGL
jgi:hypothetical protein